MDQRGDGVGASIASGSQVWNGNCADLAAAATRNPKAIRPGAGAEAVRLRQNVGDLEAPELRVDGERAGQQARRRRPVMISALMPPATALGSSLWNEISAYEHSAVISQKTKSISRLPERPARPWRR